MASVTRGAQVGLEDGPGRVAQGEIRPCPHPLPTPPPAVQDSQLWIALGCQAPWKQAVKRKPLLPTFLHSPPSSPLQGE